MLHQRCACAEIGHDRQAKNVDVLMLNDFFLSSNSFFSLSLPLVLGCCSMNVEERERRKKNVIARRILILC